MGFLNQLLKYKNICIQCHNSPDADALAAAYGVYTYLKLHDINVSIIYSGDYEIQKKDLLYMIDICEIPVEYIIDHHMPSMKKTENAFIDYSYQSCSTIVWELLKEEGYDVKANEKLSIAFLYGLYTDTSSYVDLYKKHDIAMRDELSKDYPELERLKKSSMSLEDLMIAGEALYHANFDKEKQYLLISAMHCEQSVLGIIGDMAIKVDVAKVSIAYTDIDSGYQVSIRSADREYLANEVAEKLCDGIGSGGGHIDKAGGVISRDCICESYAGWEIADIIKERMEKVMK